MPQIVIKRSSEYVNRLRAIDLYIDGKKLGNITDGEEKHFDVPKGTHALRARVDWCGSQEVSFQAQENEDVHFQLSSFQKIHRYIIGLFVLGAILFVVYVFVREVLLMNISVGAFGIALLLIIYMLTINRNKYLTLTQITNS